MEIKGYKKTTHLDKTRLGVWRKGDRIQKNPRNFQSQYIHQKPACQEEC